MSERQQLIYNYIKKFIAENHYSPSMREITDAVGLKSVSTVHGHLDRMRDKGYVDFVNTSARTLRIVS
ncbi:hypothetical protein [Sporosarcina sp. NPDC096371]|uniref:LexA family protein n=1 Tax=Sporosarcina sp. NPDC096371 TaxID=3364530 RepID=UPI00380C3684